LRMTGLLTCDMHNATDIVVRLVAMSWDLKRSVSTSPVGHLSLSLNNDR